ncbi:hypothetical protein [Thalassolituus oleivorans]|uniref:hypothetical protein n=1 Tax=Thalassolituus oleivorans TaxID=187493 RepID=UPI0023F2C573|nr:hypothetical protein [Thalassolituus oleivorans]
MTRYLLLAFGTIIFLLGCSNESSKMKGQFIEGCIASGAPKKLCSCTYQEISNGKSDDDLMRLLYSQQGQAELQQLMLPAAKKCADNL